nr:uncharacterized protein LOC111509188 [Leptinotarsa decemlineata]
MNYGLSKKQVRELAYKFAVANKKRFPPTWNGSKFAGEEWMRLFLKRHFNEGGLAIRNPEKTSMSRATSFNKSNVSRFFDNLEDVHRCFGPFPPERIWNEDEIGVTTVQNPPKIVAPKGVKQVGNVTSAERGELITVSACVNALGNHIPPMMIFPRVNYKDHMLDLASNAGVVIVTFPPHTSHRLQPLDLSVYFPFKAYYNQAVQSWLINNAGKRVDIYSVAECVGQAYHHYQHN